MFPIDFLDLHREELHKCHDRINREAWKYHAAVSPAQPESGEQRPANRLGRLKHLLASRRPAMTPAVDLC